MENLTAPGVLAVSAGHTALFWPYVGSGNELRNLLFACPFWGLVGESDL